MCIAYQIGIDTAEIAASKASVSKFNMYETLGTVYVNISVYAYKAEVWLNGKKRSEKTSRKKFHCQCGNAL